ncbi:MAG: DMT family transporter [Myxococcota bacterium]
MEAKSTGTLTTKRFLQGALLGTVAAAIWGGWPVVTRFGVQQTLNAYDICALRFSVAGLLMLPLLIRKGFFSVGVGKSLILALGAGAPYVCVSAIGLVYAPAGHLGMIEPSFMLVMSMIGGIVILGERPSRSQLLGYAIILFGVATIGMSSLTFGGGSDVIFGDLLFLFGGLLWATYTVASKKWGIKAFHATAIVSCWSMVLYLPFYLLVIGTNIPQAPVSEIVTQSIAQGVLAGVLALVFFTKSVEILGSGRGALFGTLVPGTAVLLAWPALGERPSATEWLGLVLVSLGLMLALGVIQRQLTLARERRALADRRGTGPAPILERQAG